MTERKIPLRKCVGCNEMKDKRELVRVVKNSEGEIALDVTGKLPGRGAYVCRKKACFDSAFKSRRFEKALKCRIPDEIYAGLREGIEETD